MEPAENEGNAAREGAKGAAAASPALWAVYAPTTILRPREPQRVLGRGACVRSVGGDSSGHPLEDETQMQRPLGRLLQALSGNRQVCT